MSLLSRGAWIEMAAAGAATAVFRSLLSRGAWIEIVLVLKYPNIMRVAPLTRSVD